LTRRGLLRRLASALRVLVLLAIVVGFLVSLLAIVVTGPVVVRTPRFEPDLSRAPSAERLRDHVETLSRRLAPLDASHPERLRDASGWIADTLRDCGLAVEYEDYTVRGAPYRNVVAWRAGADPGAGVTVIGAHYDTFRGYPGADDNASGVAVLLELACTLPAEPTRSGLLLAAFSTEEPPLFGGAEMGSHVFAAGLVRREVPVTLMIALDAVGCYSNAPGSQRFPVPGLGLFYPDRGSFVAVVGDLTSGAAIQRVKLGLLSARSIPVQSFRAPARLRGVDWSDHRSFRRLGLPAVLVTDTAFLRNPRYHTAQDTADTLDYEKMAALVLALHGVVRSAPSE